MRVETLKPNENNYYQNQLGALKGDHIRIKLFDDTGNKTNMLDLNLESIPQIIEYLEDMLIDVKKHLHLNRS